MKKKMSIFIISILAVLIIFGCGKNVKEIEKKEEKIVSNNVTRDFEDGPCQQENVIISNYGDPGKRLTNCFVEYPGEPSRQDKGYYIIEDICGQFTKEFMEEVMGQKLSKIESSSISGLNNCTYYLNEKDNIMLNLEYLSAEDQKKGQEMMGRKAEKNSTIQMDNYVVTQENGVANVIYLILGPEKFISLRPNSIATTDLVNLVDVAVNISQEIKGYK